METKSETIGVPAIVGLFGHSTIAGYVSADTMFGEPLLRIDVPATSKQPAFTRHYGVKAVYEIDWCSEEVMAAAAEHAQVRPINVYVPSLVSREAHNQVVAEMREQIEQLRKGLPVPEPDLGDESDDEDDDKEEFVPFLRGRGVHRTRLGGEHGRAKSTQARGGDSGVPA